MTQVKIRLREWQDKYGIGSSDTPELNTGLPCGTITCAKRRKELAENIVEKTEPVEKINEEQPDNPCANTVSMSEWLEGETEEDCRSCLLPPVIQWYTEALKESGLNELVREVEECIESSEPAEVTKKLDEIMEKVPDEVKERLMDFNCAAQTYEAPAEE